MDQIIDISSDGMHISLYRGFLITSKKQEEIARIPLDQIAGLIVHAHGTTWSNSLLTQLGDKGVPVVVCGSNHAPRSVLMPLSGHHAQGGRMRAQWQAKRPLMKQAWKQIIIAKVEMQAAVLEAFGQPSAPLRILVRKITSGDTTNIEAQAARIYWPKLMGRSFRRDINYNDVNALLNYGYTILRTASARSVVGAGLHPTIGVHHSNRNNAFSLADDLMEPFRPLVDCAAKHLALSNGTEVDSVAKHALARLIATDLPFGDGISPVSVALNKLATSLGKSYESGKLNLLLPQPPDPLTFDSLGR